MTANSAQKFRVFLGDPDLPFIFKLFLPIFIERTLNSLITTVNSYFVAGEGEAVISAISLANQLAAMLTTLFFCASGALIVVVSQLNGAGLHERAKEVVGNTLTFAVLGASVIAALLYIFPYQALKIFYGEIDNEILTQAIKYLRVYVFFLPFSAAYEVCGWTCRGYDDHKTPMILAISANTLNLLISFILIKILKIGIVGAAVGIIVINIYASVVGYTILKKRDRIPSIFKCFTLDFKAIKNVLYIGFFNSTDTIASTFAGTVRTGWLVPFGTSHITASSVITNFIGIIDSSSSVMDTLTTSLVAKSIGCGDYIKARHMFLKCYIYSLTLNSLSWLASYFILPHLFPLYTDNPETIAILGVLLIIHAIFTPLLSMFVASIRAMFNGAGDTKFTTIVSVICTFVIILGLGYILTVVCNLGIIGATLSVFAATLVKGIIYIFRYKSGKWKNHVMV